jgi:hypothetical protein
LPPADQAAGEGEEGFVDFVAAVGAQEQPAAVVESGEGAFDDPALAAEPRGVSASSSGDHGLHASLADESPVLVMVVAAISEHALWPPTRSAGATAHRWYTVEQREQLRHIVAVAARERPRERDAAGFHE